MTLSSEAQLTWEAEKNTQWSLETAPVIGGACPDELVPAKPTEALENQKKALVRPHGALANQRPACVSRPASEALC